MPNLYITEPGALLEKEAGQLLVTKHGDLLLAVPAARVEQVVLVGQAGVTTPALGMLLDRGIGLVLLTAGGRFRGRLVPNRTVSVDLRRAQYRRAEDPAFCLALARANVAGKIANARTLLLRLDETNQEPASLSAVREMAALADALPSAHSLAAVMGLEGQAARRAFGVLGRSLRPPWVLTRRARRPPPDPATRSSPFSTRCSTRAATPPSRRSGSTRIAAISINRAPAAPSWRSTSWKNSAPSSPTR